MASISAAAPQFLVDRLDDALAFYEQRLGFERDFVYEDFYASVSRDGAVIHLKCAAKLQAERAHRRSEEHLDAYLAVSGVREFQRLGRAVKSARLTVPIAASYRLADAAKAHRRLEKGHVLGKVVLRIR